MKKALMFLSWLAFKPIICQSNVWGMWCVNALCLKVAANISLLQHQEMSKPEIHLHVSGLQGLYISDNADQKYVVLFLPWFSLSFDSGSGEVTMLDMTVVLALAKLNYISWIANDHLNFQTCLKVKRFFE